MSSAQRSMVLGAPGLLQIVGRGGIPVPVGPSEMEDALHIERYGLEAEPLKLAQPDDRDLIRSGPLNGLV
jgi:hypothetical protein